MKQKLTLDRRGFLRSAAALAGATAATTAAAAVPAAAAAARTAGASAAATNTPIRGTGTELVLLGTAAGPVPMKGRVGISSALVVDGRAYLVDVGHGAFDQLGRAGLEPDSLDSIFVTHMHSDHLADLWTLFWLRFGGVNPLTHAVDVYGPGPAGALPEPSSGEETPVISPDNPTPGLSDFISTSMAATAYDLNLRMRDENWPDPRDLVRPHDIEVPDVGADPLTNVAPPMEPFLVMSDDRVSVTAILVQHPPVFPSFAFRFDTEHGSVVFSGDTTITENVVTLARGADVLVHEAIDLDAVERYGNLTEEQLQHHRAGHADVRELGAHAQRAGVPRLVLSHLAPGTVALPDESWRRKASRGFDGEVVVGTDLMRIDV
ncbi:MBL fold metallo-hydrolase [Promicromonospora sukumoe]